MNLPQYCTIGEISIFLKIPELIIKRKIKKVGIIPVKEKRMNDNEPLDLYSASDIVFSFIQPANIWKKRKWDCMNYLKCLDKASRNKKSVWPGMKCEFCKKYKNEMIL
jgi:hypothetical protein